MFNFAGTPGVSEILYKDAKNREEMLITSAVDITDHRSGNVDCEDIIPDLKLTKTIR